MAATADRPCIFTARLFANDVLHPLSKCGLITAMRFFSRYLMAALLCVALPLQAGAALARAVTMMPPAAPAHAAAGAATVHAPHAPMQVAHAIGAAHQHGAHAHHENLPKQKAGKAAPASHKAKHAKGECPTCAKCCLLAAAAPPPAAPAAFSTPMSRAPFAAAPLAIPSFLPDGPERPPRLSAAA